ncbi:MAG: DinB family protein [Acidimicrobiia bacterium]
MSDILNNAVKQAHDSLTDFEKILRSITDADLHRAQPEGGWTVAQVVSHMHLSGLLWIADLERLRHCEGDGMFMFREELGHDALGAPPPSAAEAADRIASLRTALEHCLAAADPAVLDKAMEVPPFGSLTGAEFTPLIIGHLENHAEQAKDILKVRGALPS